MSFKQWQNTTTNTTLSIEYNILWTSTDSLGITSYKVRDFQIQKSNMFGASLTTDTGWTILITNGWGFLIPSSIVYEIPPGIGIDSIPVASKANDNY